MQSNISELKAFTFLYEPMNINFFVPKQASIVKNITKNKTLYLSETPGGLS